MLRRLMNALSVLLMFHCGVWLYTIATYQLFQVTSWHDTHRKFYHIGTGIEIFLTLTALIAILGLNYILFDKPTIWNKKEK